jgi:hypothetical protein
MNIQHTISRSIGCTRVNCSTRFWGIIDPVTGCTAMDRSTVEQIVFFDPLQAGLHVQHEEPQIYQKMWATVNFNVSAELALMPIRRMKHPPEKQSEDSSFQGPSFGGRTVSICTIDQIWMLTCHTIVVLCVCHAITPLSFDAQDQAANS